MSGLVYQVVWVRELVLVFGATTFAVSTVLTAFMGGLALGSFYFGRRSEKITRPLRLYGILEIGIGLYGLAVPFIFAALPIVYHPFWQWLQLSFFAISLVRFIFAALVLIVPTALMGATLPVLATYYARDAGRIGLRVGSLYSLNTFGAVLGAAATGFVLIPNLGMHATTATAAAINLILGAVALRVSGADERESRDLSLDEVGTVQESSPVEKRRFFAWLSVLPRAYRSRKTKNESALRPAHTNERADPTGSTSAGSTSAAPERLGRAEIVTVLGGFALSGFIALSYVL
jgi:hypothetical protein